MLNGSRSKIMDCRQKSNRWWSWNPGTDTVRHEESRRKTEPDLETLIILRGLPFFLNLQFKAAGNNQNYGRQQEGSGEVQMIQNSTRANEDGSAVAPGTEEYFRASVSLASIAWRIAPTRMASGTPCVGMPVPDGKVTL